MITVIVDASRMRRVRSYPATLTQMGSPAGALKLYLTVLPGRKPISSNLDDSSSSVKPEMTAISPGLISATLLCPLFKLSIFNQPAERYSDLGILESDFIAGKYVALDQ